MQTLYWSILNISAKCHQSLVILSCTDSNLVRL